MPVAARSAVTGAFSYTGRYLTRRLLREGGEVVNFTSHPDRRHDFSAGDLARIATRPLDFARPADLARALEGCDVLYCTYWIRFAIGGDTHDAAARRLGSLFAAAKAAGVRKVVFTSHTRTTRSSPYAYIAGKALAEQLLRDCGMQHAIVRPCGLFGGAAADAILLNNAAWVLRRLPLVLLAGDGSHVFQMVHVDDMAELMHTLGARDSTADDHDACGPEAPSTAELFAMVRDAVGSRARIAPSGLPPRVVTALSKPIDWYTGDIMLDGDDMDLLCSGLTRAGDPLDPLIAPRRSLQAWLQEVGPGLGVEYVSSVRRYYK